MAAGSRILDSFLTWGLEEQVRADWSPYMSFDVVPPACRDARCPITPMARLLL
jgi:hypothetical protein